MRIAAHVARVLAALALFVVSTAAASSVSAGGDDPLARHFGGPFSLTSHDGRTVIDTDFRGTFMLIAFGYTHCPDICPTVLADMTQALEGLGPAADRIQPIFITIDPARDTPELLAKYRASFHPRLLMLTGSEPEIAAVAKAYRVHRRKYLLRKDASAAAADGNYGVDHGSLVYLMGPDGKFLTFYPYMTPPEKIRATLKHYLETGAAAH